ncbi:MAG: hypothetical protein GEV06_18250 [Luteitalea sp.]|nr:hypothetical protein [Luteitalea sp.]
MARWLFRWVRLLFAVAVVSVLVTGQPRADSLDLSPNLPSHQPVGTRIVWTASATAPATSKYQFSIAHETGDYVIVRDFQDVNAFSWTPLDEGVFSIRVVARAGLTRVERVAPFTIVSRTTGSRAVVTTTSHPLVALYNVPPCSEGKRVFVELAEEASFSWTRTSTKDCVADRSLSFYVAGMRPQQTYWMRHAVTEGFVTLRSQVTQFTTGSSPITMPGMEVLDPPDLETSSREAVVLHAVLDAARPTSNFPIATDLAGRLIWYYDRLAVRGTFAYVTRPVPGGSMLMLAACCNGRDHVLVEIDLAGNTIRQTPMSRINEQLRARGDEAVRALHHDAVRFPNGQTLVLGMLERSGVLPDQPMLADMVIALDANLQVAWTWNAFDHLDTSRAAVLNENCLAAYGAACAASSPFAHDWLHSNSLAYAPADGNLIISMRHQDWIVKVDYRDGMGSGDVIWRLGQDGDFTVVSQDPHPWFSHQHDASYINPTTIAVYDNGNTRCANAEGSCNSRGQVYALDEARGIATLRVNADLGVYSDRLGSAQQLSNGNFAFGSGSVEARFSDLTELGAGSGATFGLRAGIAAYRTLRLRSMYEY